MFIENVKNTQNEWWRYLLVGPLVIIVFWQFLGAIPLLIGLFSVADLDQLQTLNESNFLNAFPNYNVGLALFCITFLPFFATVTYCSITISYITFALVQPVV